MSPLFPYLDRYISVRRAMGYHPDNDAYLLSDFVRYLDETGQDTLTVRSALTWADRAARDQQAARRLRAVRGFARYLSGFEPDTQVPPSRLVANTVSRPTPHIYTDEEVTALMAAADELTPRPWAATMAAVIGLMAATGLRPGEVYRLDRSDVDLDAGRLAVMHSKHGKSRRIPLHATTVEALRRYALARDSSVAGPAGTNFFLTGDGRPLTSQAVTGCFRRLVRLADSEASSERPAKLGDLRHSFAVHTLLAWHQAGMDVQRQLPVLSAFLGHNEPAHTFWYLQAVPELMAIAAGRLEAFWQTRP